jgi:DNA-binding transcriptional MerR regulator
LSRRYRVHEFAGLAGVTVKTLHHYDRLGLPTPTRTDAGYRLYAEADPERLEQIIALKFLGFSLKQVRDILKRTSVELADALRWQRQAIEDKQAHLGRALQAMRAAEKALDLGHPARSAILKRIIEVIDVQHDIELMKQYCLQVKPVREPDDRNGHVRFDERKGETERWASRRTRPRKRSRAFGAAGPVRRRAQRALSEADRRLVRGLIRRVRVSRKSARTRSRARRRLLRCTQSSQPTH